MKDMPKWLKTAVSAGVMSCHHCKTKFSLDDVHRFLSGPLPEKNYPVFLVQFYCRECQESHLYYQGTMTASHIDRAIRRGDCAGHSDSAPESEEAPLDGMQHTDAVDES